MLIGHFIPPRWVIDRLSQRRVIDQKTDVLSQVHGAMLKITLLVPLAPSRLLPMLAQQMPKINKKDNVSLFSLVTFSSRWHKLSRSCFIVLQVVVIYVENLFKLESSPIGQVGSSMIFMMVMERLRDLDVSKEYVLLYK